MIFFHLKYKHNPNVTKSGNKHSKHRWSERQHLWSLSDLAVGMGYKNNKTLWRRWQWLVPNFRDRRNIKRLSSHPWAGAPCKSLPHEVRIIMKRIVDQPKPHWKRLVMIWRHLGPQSQRTPFYDVISWNFAGPANLKKAILSLPVSIWMIQSRLGRKFSGQMFGGSEMLSMTQRTPSLHSSMEVETLYFGAVFLSTVQDNFTTLGDYAT